LEGLEDFLPKYFKPFPGINKFYHFLFRSSEPGVVYVKERCDSELVRKMLLKQNVLLDKNDRPGILPPAGLSEKRQHYLQTVVRPYVRAACQDITCPPVEEE